MGNFYVNLTTVGPDQQQVVECLNTLNRIAYVGPTIGNATVLYDKEADSQSAAVVTLGQSVSKSLDCSLLALGNHDDDILFFWLIEHGAVKCEYDSFPGYFTDGERTPSGADAEALCKAFGRDDEDTLDEVDAVLTEEEDYVFALDRHKELCEWLGIPWQYACICFGDVDSNNLVDGTSIDDFLKTNI